MKKIDALIKQLGQLDTEQVNPVTINIDRLSPIEIVSRISDEDKKVPLAVEKALGPIAKAAELYAETIRRGKRIFYIGAGTSGRLGVLDAAECPPTFGTEPDQIIGVISGGHETLVQSREGVEDDEEAAETDLKSYDLSAGDFVIGIAASCRTPYTLAGVRFAQTRGCNTALIICNRAADMELKPDIVIELLVGPEVITGSTRMKSGSAQKMALNMISTTAMILLGKTYGNLMVDLQAKSNKLDARSRKLLIDLVGVNSDEASDLLENARGSVKLAIVMRSLSCDRLEAEKRLEQAGGFISRLLPKNKSSGKGEK